MSRGYQELSLKRSHKFNENNLNYFYLANNKKKTVYNLTPIEFYNKYVDFNPDDYVVERIECPSHDGRMVPITIVRHKNTKVDGTANLFLYGYGSYGNSMSPGFS